MVHVFIPPPPSLSFELPPRLKLRIAEAVTLFSRIDCVIIETRWVNEGADLARKKAIAKAPAAANISALKEMLEGLGLPASENAHVWGAFERLKNDRNIIGHGVWMVDDKFVPWVLWHSHFLEDDQSVVSEQFPYERFGQLLKIAQHLLETLTKFKGMIEDLAEARKKVEA